MADHKNPETADEAYKALLERNYGPEGTAHLKACGEKLYHEGDVVGAAVEGVKAAIAGVEHIPSVFTRSGKGR